MSLTRRGFLGFLAGAVAAAPAAVALAEELVTPKRTIFLPPRGGWRWGEEVMAQYHQFIETTLGSYTSAVEHLGVSVSVADSAEWERFKLEHHISATVDPRVYPEFRQAVDVWPSMYGRVSKRDWDTYERVARILEAAKEAG
jgi:hypothetical protein